MTQKGILYVVATPIGNLNDISNRAIEVLSSVFFIAAEDTRHTKKLLNALGITTRLVSCHEHNEKDCAEKILEALSQKKDVAIVSDAGTPCLCDPGAKIIKRAWSEGYICSPIPGASAITAILSVSGFYGDEFHFGGFLPEKKNPRRERLTYLANFKSPFVIFEAPHRIKESLEDIYEIVGDRQMVLGRELTKLYETFYVDTVSNVAKLIKERDVLGEIVMVVEGYKGDENVLSPEDEAQISKLLNLVTSPESLAPKDACRMLSPLLGSSVQRLYDIYLKKNKS